MFDEKIMDYLPHDIRLITAGLVDDNPDTALKGPIKVIGHEQFQFGQFRNLLNRLITPVPPAHHRPRGSSCSRQKATTSR